MMIVFLQKDKTTPAATLKPPSRTVANVFGDESDDEPEEMPPEARMRMRNIGRYIDRLCVDLVALTWGDFMYESQIRFPYR